jgi:hypothetical protein
MMASDESLELNSGAVRTSVMPTLTLVVVEVVDRRIKCGSEIPENRDRGCVRYFRRR